LSHKEASKYQHKGFPLYELLACLFLEVCPSGEYVCTAAIRSQEEDGQASNEDLSDALEVSQSHSVDDLSILFDIDFQSGLGEEI